jgi:serine/threonine protein kinase
MDPHLWQRIEELFNAALEVPPEKRRQFLDSACAGDQLMQAEVLSLLEKSDANEPFLSQPIFDVGAKIISQQADEALAGKTLGAYTLVRPIGRGGMGEVYLAHDVRLGRKVALKLLPNLLRPDPDGERRFKHEARAASAISHPNIAHIYEIGEAEGRLFIAMEFVDGVTLRERLSKHDLLFREALDIATQVASGIAAAHAEGIVHRDIKPENIIIRPDGLVKVVDFGLAKLSEPNRAEADQTHTTTRRRTTQTIHTEPGLLMGTATYMSPEQARGQRVDARTDIWSWGVVFYEMLAGRSPFAGATNSDVIAEILKSEPGLLQTGIPCLPNLATQILRRALSKETAARYADASSLVPALNELSIISRQQRVLEMALPLDEMGLASSTNGSAVSSAELRREVTTAPTASIFADSSAPDKRSNKIVNPRPAAGSNRRVVAVSILGVLAILTTTLVLMKSGALSRQTARPTKALELVPLSTNGHTMDGSISPDGKLLAFALIDSGKQSLRIRNLETEESWELLPPDPALCWGMRFTPNGQSVFYNSTQPGSTVSVLYRLPVRGGPSQKIVVNLDTPVAFSPDGTQITFIRSYPAQHRDSLIIANVDGTSEREIITRQHPDKFAFAGVAWSPDGKIIAAAASRKNETELAVLAVPVSGGEPVELTPWLWSAVRGLAWANDGRALLFSGQNSGTRPIELWRVSYPDKQLTQLTRGGRQYESITLAPNALVTSETDEVSDIWSLNLSGEPKRLTNDGHSGGDGLRVTSTGWIVFTVGENEQSSLWRMNLNGEDRTQLATNNGFVPTPSRDGKTIAYASTAGGGHHIWLVNVDGQNNHQLTFGDGENYPSFTADGQWIVYTSRAKARGTLWKIPVAGGPPTQLTFSGITLRPVVSPDGTSIACTYRTDETDRWKIAVFPFAGGEPTRTFALPYPYNQVIRWTPDSRALTYLDKVNGVHNLWRQPVDGSAPTKLTNFNEDLILNYDWLASGQELILSRGGRRRDAVLVRNFE